MEIHIELTRDDYSNFNKYYFLNKGLKKRIYIVLITALIIPLIVGNNNPFNILTYITTALFSGLLFGSIYLGSLYFLMIWTKRLPANDGSILGKKKFQLTNEGLIEESENNTNIQKWKGIKTIETNDKYVFIFVDNIAAYIIPKKCFLNEKEQNYFIRTISEKINNPS